MARIGKENYYLDIAGTVLERSTCMRRHYGAIIVQNDEIVSSGYNGAPRRDILGSTLYMVCRDPASGGLIPGSTSCSMCRRLIINAGITKVVIRDTPGQYRVVDVQKEWVEDDNSIPEHLQ